MLTQWCRQALCQIIPSNVCELLVASGVLAIALEWWTQPLELSSGTIGAHVLVGLLREDRRGW